MTAKNVKTALSELGFKTRKAPEGVIRMNQLFKPLDGDTITVQIEVTPTDAWASVYETTYFKTRRGGRNYRTHYFVQGWGNKSNGQNEDFYLAYEAFGSSEQVRFLDIVDRAIAVARNKVSERNAEHEKWEREKPEGWDQMSRLEQSKFMTARMMENIAALRASKET